MTPAEKMQQTWSLEAFSESCVIAFTSLEQYSGNALQASSQIQLLSQGPLAAFFVRSSGLMPAIVRDPLKVRDVRILWSLQFLPWPRNSTDTKWVLVNVSHAFLKCKQVEWYPRMLNPCAGTHCPGRMLGFVSQMIPLNLKFRKAALSDPRRPIQGTQETQKDLSQET